MSPHIATSTVETPRGRLEVSTGGPADGRLVLSHHGTPGAGLLFGRAITAGADRGLRHAAYSRPGYGGSTRQANRTVADCAADAAAVADALDAPTFFTVGASGGGPHALACAALLPDRVSAAATIAGAAPHEAEGLDWLAGMGQDNVDEFNAAVAGEDVLRAFLGQHEEALRHVTGTSIAAGLGDLLSDVDARALTGPYADYMARTLRTALSHGLDGWVDDDLALIRGDWGFPLEFSVPVSIWQGAEDRMVPYAHGEWFARHVSEATAHLLPHEGHLSLGVGHYGDVLDDLLAQAE